MSESPLGNAKDSLLQATISMISTIRRSVIAMLDPFHSRPSSLLASRLGLITIGWFNTYWFLQSPWTSPSPHVVHLCVLLLQLCPTIATYFHQHMMLRSVQQAASVDRLNTAVFLKHNVIPPIPSSAQMQSTNSATSTASTSASIQNSNITTGSLSNRAMGMSRSSNEIYIPPDNRSSYAQLSHRTSSSRYTRSRSPVLDVTQSLYRATGVKGRMQREVSSDRHRSISPNMVYLQHNRIHPESHILKSTNRKILLEEKEIPVEIVPNSTAHLTPATNPIHPTTANRLLANIARTTSHPSSALGTHIDSTTTAASTNVSTALGMMHLPNKVLKETRRKRNEK